MPVELDHLFVFVQPQPSEPTHLTAAGLQESFRRDHPGQGTTNVCCCFDNAYLELLWLHDPDRARDPAVARMRLAERAAWQTSGASPFGIAVRIDPDRALPFETWDYAAPFLPAGVTIPVAVASDDPRQPLLFRSPGSQRPETWTDGRGDRRQGHAGLAEIVHFRIDLAEGVCPTQALIGLQEIGIVSLGSAPEHRVVLTLSRPGGAPRRLTLPAFSWEE
jgi:hypothetical protein